MINIALTFALFKFGKTKLGDKIASIKRDLILFKFTKKEDYFEPKQFSMYYCTGFMAGFSTGLIGLGAVTIYIF